MPKLKLTHRFVDAVETETRTDFWDAQVHGLVLRVSPPTGRNRDGAKSWNVVFTREVDRAKVRHTIGTWPHMDLEGARKAALAAMAKVAAGDDPSAKRRLLRESATFGELIEEFLEKYSRLRKRSWKEDERLLGPTYINDSLRARKIVSLRKVDFLELIDDKMAEGKVALARSLHAALRKLFGWAVERDLLETSPMATIKAPGKPPQRDRVLSDAELGAIWNAIGTTSMSAEMRDVLRLLMLTGARVAEVAELTAGEIDLERAEWLLPGERAKNGRAHVVPLADEALEILRQALARRPGIGHGDRLFGRGGTAITPNGVAQAVRKRLQIVGERWTAHDLRRSLATGLAGLGVAPHIIEALLNHQSGFRSSVAGIYNRNAYEPEKRQALVIWETHVLSVSNVRKTVVVPLAGRAKK